MFRKRKQREILEKQKNISEKFGNWKKAEQEKLYTKLKEKEKLLWHRLNLVFLLRKQILIVEFLTIIALTAIQFTQTTQK